MPLKINEVWDLVELPENRTAIVSKWAFLVKTDANGTIQTRKPRRSEFQYNFWRRLWWNIFTVASFQSVRIVTALAAQQDSKVYQMEVTAEFLNGQLKEEIYIKQPEGLLRKERTPGLQVTSKYLSP